MGVSAQGSQAKLAFDAVLPFDGSSEAYEFINESLQMVQTHVNTQGIRGTRSRLKGRTRIASEQITGSIVMQPSVTELDRLWPRILGGATNLGVTDVADTLPEFQVMIDRITKVFTYAGCVVSSAVISGSSGQPISLTLNIEGETESVGNSGTFPSLSIDTDTMFVFSDVVLTLDGTARELSAFTLTIDNLLDTGRYMNSVTRSQIPTQDRQVTLAVTLPYTTDEDDLYDIAIAGIDGSLALDDGTTTYTFDFGNLKSAARSPVVTGKTEIIHPITFDCYKSGSDSEIKVTKS